MLEKLEVNNPLFQLYSVENYKVKITSKDNPLAKKPIEYLQ